MLLDLVLVREPRCHELAELEQRALRGGVAVDRERARLRGAVLLDVLEVVARETLRRRGEHREARVHGHGTGAVDLGGEIGCRLDGAGASHPLVHLLADLAHARAGRVAEPEGLVARQRLRRAAGLDGRVDGVDHRLFRLIHVLEREGRLAVERVREEPQRGQGELCRGHLTEEGAREGARLEGLGDLAR